MRAPSPIGRAWSARPRTARIWSVAAFSLARGLPGAVLWTALLLGAPIAAGAAALPAPRTLELLPVREQHVRLRLPAGRAPQGVRLLVSGAVPPFRHTGEWLELTVPSIRAHEVIAVDLA